jgi:glycosyltransferase involved in cell wall biosynthesis
MTGAPTTEMPRIVVVTSRLDVGGTERHLARVLPALRRGLDVVLYVMERGGSLDHELLAQGVRIEGPSRARFLHWPKATLALALFLWRERPTVIHFFLPRPYIFGSVAAELAGQRRRLMSRRSLTDYQGRYLLLRSVERLLHSRTLGVIGNSRAVIDQLAAEVNDHRKLALIHNGIEVPAQISASERGRVRESLRISSDAVVIAVVANLIAYKGHWDLIEALALIKKDLPINWRLLVIGRDDGIGAELKQKAEAINIAGNILWLGERSDVGALLALSDIFVLPSHQEGFSNALLEAMAVGVAGIATAVGGNLDAVIDNQTGLLVRPKDPRALAAALLRLAQDPALRRRYAEAGRRCIEKQFTLDACVGRYEKLYRAMSESTPKPVAEILADDGRGSDRDNVTASPEYAT